MRTANRTKPRSVRNEALGDTAPREREGSLTAKHVHAVSSGDLSKTLDAFEPAWATMGG